jgi:valyl-tRNA synthetase
MVFAGLEFTGRLPFEKVYFHSIIRDLEGRKMSKSLGNSPDPLAVIDQYGADALRYTVIALAPTGQDVLFGEEKCELGRNFANKLWNTARFALMHLSDKAASAPGASALALEDKWILSRYHRAVREVSDRIEAFHFSEAQAAAYRFVWNELCDWYVEFIKPRLARDADPASKAAACHVLHETLTGAVKLLHPFMPFITEEIYGVLPRAAGRGGALMTSPWPKADPARVDPKTEACADFVREVVSSIRNLRAGQNIPPSKKGSVVIHAEDAQKREWLNTMDSAVRTLSRTGTLHVTPSAEKPASAATAVTSGVTIYLNLEGMVDKTAEREKILRAIDKAKGFLASVEKKLGNEKFLKNAPKAVLTKEEGKRADTREKIRKLEGNLKMYE